MTTSQKPAVAAGPSTTRELADLLRRSVSEWNQWRAQHPEIEQVDLKGACLSGLNLTGANLSGADLQSADLRGSDLTVADLHRADLDRANLYGTVLTGAQTYACMGLPAEIRLQLVSELIKSWEYD